MSVLIGEITWRLAAVCVDAFKESKDDRVCLIVSDTRSSSRKLKFVIFTKASQRRQQLHFNNKHVIIVQSTSVLNSDRSEQTKQSVDQCLFAEA